MARTNGAGSGERGGTAYDITVVGAGPAGAAAAAVLAGKHYRVAIVDRDVVPQGRPGLDWLAGRAAPLLSRLGVAVSNVLSRPFTEVTFHNADFSKATKPRFKEPPGYLVDRRILHGALLTAATSAGATLLAGRGVTGIRLLERSTQVKLADDSHLESKLVLLASGRGTELLELVGLTRSGAGVVVWAAQVIAPLKTGAATELRVDVVLGLDRRNSFAMFCVSQDLACVTVHWYGESTAAVPALVAACKAGFERNLVPLDLSADAAKAKPVRCPTAAALDMDTHVGKHTLLVGDAGGFVAAVSNEGLYPAIWSAQIAAEVADEALRSVHPQDTLKDFDARWRMQMADYLRSPNTDAQFLLPLVFSNQPMADRMGAAFFFGDNI